MGIQPIKNTGCWFVGGDDLTGAVHVLKLQLSQPPPLSLAPIKSSIEMFWYQLVIILIISCVGGRHNMPHPCDLDLLTLTCDVGYLCTNFSLPRPLCSRLRHEVRNIQTDRQRSDIVT